MSVSASDADTASPAKPSATGDVHRTRATRSLTRDHGLFQRVVRALPQVEIVPESNALRLRAASVLAATRAG